MKKFIFIFIFYFMASCLFFEFSVYAEELSLQEYIRLAAEKDTVFQEILINELKLKYQKTLGLPAEDFILSAQSEYSFFFDDSTGDSENMIGLSKLFPLSGTLVSAEYDSALRAGTREVSSEFTLRVSQPIAKNAFGKATRLLDSIIGIEIDVAKYQIVEAYEDYLATLIQTYYSWYSAYERLKTGEFSYNENTKLLENIKEREKSKIALPIDVNKITLQVISKKENLYVLKNDYVRCTNFIKRAVCYDDSINIKPENPSLYEDTLIYFEGDYDSFKKASRTFRILQLLEEKGGLEVERSADELLPSIDLLGGYTIQGEGHGLKDRSDFVFIGFSLDLPLQRSVEKAKLETTKIELRKTRLSTESIHAELNVTLKNIYDEIARERKLIFLAEEKIGVARSIVEDESKNYSLGKVTLNDFIDVVNILEDNKFNKILHEVQLKKLIIEWLRLTDRLVTENQVLHE